MGVVERESLAHGSMVSDAPRIIPASVRGTAGRRRRSASRGTDIIGPVPRKPARRRPVPSGPRTPGRAGASARASSAGTGATSGTSPGDGRATPTTCWSRRSCSSRPRWTGSSRSTTSSSAATRRSRRWPRRTSPTSTRTWYPLGYNIRPVHLHGIAREAVARYGGRLPADDKALRAMKGIGRYTAGAVRSFAYGARAPILDTNVRRVLGRVFHGERRPPRLDGRRCGRSPSGSSRARASTTSTRP